MDNIDLKEVERALVFVGEAQQHMRDLVNQLDQLCYPDEDAPSNQRLRLAQDALHSIDMTKAALVFAKLQ